MLLLFPEIKPIWESWPAPNGVGTWHRHTSRWRVRHCGHPTAHRPWMVWSPEGLAMLTEAGLAWSHLADAKAAVEAILRGEATTREDEKGRLIFSPAPRPTTNAGKAAGVAEQ